MKASTINDRWTNLLNPTARPLVLFLVISGVSSFRVAWAILTERWTWPGIFGLPITIVLALFPQVLARIATRFEESGLRRMPARRRA